jgi:hypothetical protein
MAVVAYDFFEKNRCLNALSDMNWIHVSDYPLERDYLGMVTAEAEHFPRCRLIAKPFLPREILSFVGQVLAAA